MARMMVQHRTTGETFVIDPDNMTATLPLSGGETDEPLEHYNLDQDMDSFDSEEWNYLRYEFEPAVETATAQMQWFDAHPECALPTDDHTDTAIRHELQARRIRSGATWATVSPADFRSAVWAGMNAWAAEAAEVE